MEKEKGKKGRKSAVAVDTALNSWAWSGWLGSTCHPLSPLRLAWTVGGLALPLATTTVVRETAPLQCRIVARSADTDLCAGWTEPDPVVMHPPQIRSFFRYLNEHEDVAALTHSHTRTHTHTHTHRWPIPSRRSTSQADYSARIDHQEWNGSYACPLDYGAPKAGRAAH